MTYLNTFNPITSQNAAFHSELLNKILWKTACFNIGNIYLILYQSSQNMWTKQKIIYKHGVFSVI